MIDLAETLSGQFLFETPRLTCRRWRASDEDMLFSVYSDEEVSRYIGDGQPISREECRAWLDVTATNYRTRGYGMFALEEKPDGQVVGFCGLVHPGGQPDPEVKYAFFNSHWGQGLASEMVPALLRFGHETFDLGRIIATVDDNNHASSRVLEKSGMRFVNLLESANEPPVRYYEWCV